MRRSFGPLLALALALAPAAASAQLDPGAGGGWRELFDPERRMALLYRQDGLRRLLQSMGGEEDLDPALGDPPRHLLLDQALLRFERARRAMPGDPELAYYTAHALTRYRRPAPDGSTELRVEEAIDAWNRVRAIDPSFAADRVAYELAALHMRRHEFPEALAEYDAALRHAVPPTVDLMDRFFAPTGMERRLAILFAPLDPANVHGNLAEAAMLSGELGRAAAHYGAALDEARDPITRSLAQWGLAVTLDRGGSHDEALRLAARTLRDDPVGAVPDWYAISRAHGAFAVLHLEFVFFEPAYELYAYEAIGHEALAHPDGGARNADELRLALRSWRLFLTEGGTASRYAPIARRSIERLERELAGNATPAPSRRRR